MSIFKIGYTAHKEILHFQQIKIKQYCAPPTYFTRIYERDEDYQAINHPQ